MTATTPPTAIRPITAAPPSPATGRETVRPQRFSTLFGIELRKLTDTRAGKLLLAASLVVSAGLLTYKVARVADGEIAVFRIYLNALFPALIVLVPMIGLVAMTSEWTQRTALTTFTMSPRRGRVIAAKFVAALSLSTAVLALTTTLALAATALGGALGDGANYTDAGLGVRELIVVTLLQVIMASSFGALVPMTSVAVGAFIVAPTVWAAAGPELLGTSSRWLDVFMAYDRLGSQHPWEHLPQTITSIAAWVVVPAVIGVGRSLRREVK